MSMGHISQTYTDETVELSVGEYVKGMASTNGIELFWALLKRDFCGVYHRMSEVHLDRYVNEFCFRQNKKDESDERTFSGFFIVGMDVN